MKVPLGQNVRQQALLQVYRKPNGTTYPKHLREAGQQLPQQPHCCSDEQLMLAHQNSMSSSSVASISSGSLAAYASPATLELAAKAAV